jgi:hypothetical protein
MRENCAALGTAKRSRGTCMHRGRRVGYWAPTRKWNSINLYALQTLVQGKVSQAELAGELRTLTGDTLTHK